MKTTNTITPATTSLTPEEFIAMFLPLLIAMKVTRENDSAHYERNEETGKIELHIDRDAYRAMPDEEKQRLWESFHWSRANGCWISRYIDADDIAQQAELVDEAPKPKAKPAAPARSAAPKAKPKTERPETISPAQRFTPAAVGTISSEDIEHALRRGSGFAGGKMRIAAFYASNHTPDEAKSFLKEEYGIGGCSHTFLNGASGFVDYDAKGIEVREWKTDNRIRLSWVSVDSYIRGMIRNGTYLTADEQKTFDAMKAKQRGKLPTPQPRMHYAPADAVA